MKFMEENMNSLRKSFYLNTMLASMAAIVHDTAANWRSMRIEC